MNCMYLCDVYIYECICTRLIRPNVSSVCMCLWLVCIYVMCICMSVYARVWYVQIWVVLSFVLWIYMYLSWCAYLFICIYHDVHICLYVYVYECMCTCLMCLKIVMCLYIIYVYCVYILYILMCICVCVCTYILNVLVCICVCVCTCMSVYTRVWNTVFVSFEYANAFVSVHVCMYVFMMWICMPDMSMACLIDSSLHMYAYICMRIYEDIHKYTRKCSFYMHMYLCMHTFFIHVSL